MNRKRLLQYANLWKPPLLLTVLLSAPRLPYCPYFFWRQDCPVWLLSPNSQGLEEAIDLRVKLILENDYDILINIGGSDASGGADA